MIKVCYEVQPPTLGKVVHRINAAMKRYVPGNVTFVNDPEKADIQILDVIGTGSLPFLKNKNYVLFQHCYWTTETADPNYWLPIFRGAKLVAGYLDLYGKTGSTDFNMLRIGWGADFDIFYNEGIDRPYTALTTGYVAETECIREVYEAIHSLNKKMVQIGKKFSYGPGFFDVENITDAFLRHFYCSSKYVCGMRRLEGLEFPVVEGALCGARPICLDQEDYHYFFGDIPIFIKETGQDYYNNSINQTTINTLIDIFREEPRPIGEEETKFLKDNFSWEKNITTIWERILNA